MSMKFFTTRGGKVEALSVQGIKVCASHKVISSLVTEALSSEHAKLFAEPVIDKKSQDIDWYYADDVELVPAQSLSQNERGIVEEKARKYDAEIREKFEFDEKYKEHKDLLFGALRHTGESDLYAAGTQPVLINWGFALAGESAKPYELRQRGSSAPSEEEEKKKREPELEDGNQPDTGTGSQNTEGGGEQQVDTGNTGTGSQNTTGGGNELSFLSSPSGLLIRGLLKLLALLLALAALALLLSRCSSGMNFNLPSVFGGAGSGISRPSDGPALPPGGGAEMSSPQAVTPPPSQVPQAPFVGGSPAGPPSVQGTAPSSTPSGIPFGTPMGPALSVPQDEAAELAAEQAREEVLRKEIESTRQRLVERNREYRDSLPPPKTPANLPEDIAFMEGCWIAETGLVDSVTGVPVVVEYCFDRSGQGMRRMTEPDGLVCQGPATVSYSSGLLVLRAGEAHCPQGREAYVPHTVQCRDGGALAMCSGQEEGGDAWTARFRRK